MTETYQNPSPIACVLSGLWTMIVYTQPSGFGIHRAHIERIDAGEIRECEYVGCVQELIEYDCVMRVQGDPATVARYASLRGKVAWEGMR